LTAFVSFVQTFAVWIYLLCGFGILFAIKMLVDAQRLSRATLFSLEQERASEQTYRALIVMLVFFVAIVLVTLVIGVLAPIVPSGGPVILRGATTTLAPLILPTNTSVPTITLTPPRSTEIPFATNIPITTTVIRTVTRSAPPVPPATATIVYVFPAPKIIGPVPNGVVVTGFDRARNDLNFQWTWDCTQCRLGSEDRFVITVSFTDKATGATRFVGGSTSNNYLTMWDILRGSGQEVWHQAKEDAFQWYVQVKRGEQPISPPSETWKFVWH
jgi:hypothetical protein